MISSVFSCDCQAGEPRASPLSSHGDSVRLPSISASQARADCTPHVPCVDLALTRVGVGLSRCLSHSGETCSGSFRFGFVSDEWEQVV